MICQKFTDKNILKLKKQLKFFPEISDRDFWENAKPYSIEFFEKNVKRYEGIERKHLTATLCRKYAVDGDRVEFEKVYFSRRSELVNKVILECFHNDGRYMDDILDLVWMILEETSWTIAAHYSNSVAADSLPWCENDCIDLFSAETACTMAFVYQTLKEKLDEISRNITPRIVKRIEEQLDVYLNSEGFWWYGRPGYAPNNWNPWINSNILTCAFAVVEDEDRLRDIVYKALISLDYYFDNYPDDGACDEGPSYWNQAGLSMLESLWILNLGTDGQINFFGEEKVKNTLEFFMKYDTGNSQAVNFADAGINVVSYYPSLYKMAKLSANQKTMSFSKMLYDTVNAAKMPASNATARMAHLAGSMPKAHRMMDIIKYSPEMDKLDVAEFKPDSDYYLESIQVVTSRYRSDAREGIFFAAKGGHNNEHHNHNDIGNFIVYKNGTKFLIDSGNMQYRKGTFGAGRYTLKSTRSAYHNVPLIDGIEQQEGQQYCAKNAVLEKSENKTFFSVDIADAYPDKIAEKWVRSIDYDKAAQKMTVTEDFALAKESEISLNFLTPQNVEFAGNSVIITAENGEILEMAFDNQMEFEIEKVDYDNDHLIRLNWGENIYRISMITKAKSGKITYVIK
ncbi:MAG: heparinase II/III family protein [Clostridia bacterium]|nr:heparinase II/III family protein [Clostridia bacterium]